jgi:hypothetical protein
VTLREWLVQQRTEAEDRQQEAEEYSYALILHTLEEQHAPCLDAPVTPPREEHAHVDPAP